MSEPQSAGAVVMVRPRAFTSNPETLASNSFQRAVTPGERDIATAALGEWSALADALAEHGVRVHRFEGLGDGSAPDEPFPNNWVSFHADGTVVLYPMMAASRRLERRSEIIEALTREHGYAITRTVDLTAFELRGEFLEGTGSLVLDRINHVAYACLSPRTHPAALAEFARRLEYEVVAFTALDARGAAIYHTNVLLSLGTRFALLAPAAIRDARQRRNVLSRLRASGRELIEFDYSQLDRFVGNALELAAPSGAVIALSTRAWEALDESQRAALASHGRIAAIEAGTIETFGGGGVRCMLAELALPLGSASR
jgi:hypothetical protein